jgi:sugar O-acyltransferase (sialic acid O-acetyltransferase NeuD family)
VSQPLVIVGAGGHGREVLDVVEAVGGYEVLGFVDDGDPDEPLLVDRGQRLLGGTAAVAELGEVAYVVGIGDPRIRMKVVGAIGTTGPAKPAPALVHPLASTGTRCSFGPGTVVAAGARLTTNITVGQHCYIGPNATIGHDAVLHDGATLYPGAVVSGNVTIGRAATVGAGASVKQGVHIGTVAFVALGAGVVRDVPDATTVAGTPARRLGSRARRR